MAEKTKLKIAAIQMNATPRWTENLQSAERLVSEAAANAARLVILPEFFIQMSEINDPARLEIAEELGAGIIQSRLATLARKQQIYLVAGTLLIKNQQTGSYYNTCIVYQPDGSQLAYYHKIHLFKFDDGVTKFDESATFSAGDKLCSFMLDDFKIGLSVCYDLRFPELFRALSPLDAILLPAAFIYTTGAAHWELLCRARAVENQCYFIAVNQGGVHESGRRTFGHSLVVDPWGGLLTQCAEQKEVILYATLDKEFIAQVRTQLPALDHRRLC